MCVVPNLVGESIKIAGDLWAIKGHGNDDGAQFTTALVFSPLVGKNDSGRVISQSIPANGNRPCASTAMTVTWSP
jgi:hypothetical protein